jgi:lipoyl(octanoyl) transferase
MPTIEWKTSTDLIPYEEALSFMEERVRALAADETLDECIWFLEHPPLYTAGTSADESDLLVKDRSPSTRLGVVGSTPITGRANAWPM